MVLSLSAHSAASGLYLLFRHKALDMHEGRLMQGEVVYCNLCFLLSLKLFFLSSVCCLLHITLPPPLTLADGLLYLRKAPPPTPLLRLFFCTLTQLKNKGFLQLANIKKDDAQRFQGVAVRRVAK